HIISVLRTDATIRSGFVAAAESIRNSDALDKNDKDKLKAVARSVVPQLPEDQSMCRLIHEDHPHPAGLLVSILLLSLGAPFWFNALKNLVELRSVIAKKEQNERGGASATPDAGDGITWKEAAHA